MVSPMLRHILSRNRQLLQNINHTPFRYNGLNISGRRHMSALEEFSKRVKGEIESNPELKKSIEELKTKAEGLKGKAEGLKGKVEGLKEMTEGLKTRTKQTTEMLYKQAGAVRTEAEVKAKQVSAVMKDKISAATEQAKELRDNFKVRSTEVPEKDKVNTDNASAKDASENISKQGAEKLANESTQKVESSDQTVVGKIGEGIASVASTAFKSLKEAKLSDMTKKGYNIIKEELTTTPSRRRRLKVEDAVNSYKERSSETQIVAVEVKPSRIGKKWEELKDKVRSLPLYKRVKGISEHPAVAKSHEVMEDIKEQLETMDNPVVNKIQDFKDNITSESPAAISYKEIRRRDPLFTLPDFIEDVQQIVHPTLKAYLKGDIEALKKHCSVEVIDKCKAQTKAYQSLGFDRKILHISDIEVSEVKMMGNIPIIVVDFQTQQLYCVRDKSGKITQESKDDIHSVYYRWAMLLTDPEESGEGNLYPRWVLREMQEQGMKALI